MVSKKGIKKTKSEKIVTPAVESVIAEPSLDRDSIIKEITEKVVGVLLPELKKSVSSNVSESFEQVKNIVTNELKDIRSHMETTPNAAEPPVMDSTVMESPQPQTAPTPTPAAPMGMEAILPLIQMLGLGQSEQTGNSQSGLMNMFMESMMRNSMANLTRNDGMQDLMMKAAFKKILGEEPPANIMKTTDELMSPLNNYGAKAQAAREAAKNNL